MLRALSPLAMKVISDGSNTNSQKEFTSIKVLGRCLELLGVEKNRIAVINFLRCAAPLLGHQLKPQWDTRLRELAQIVEEEHQNGLTFTVERSEFSFNIIDNYLCIY